MGRVREKRRVEKKRSEKRKSQKKEDADARKGRQVAKHCVFPMICGSGGSKSRLAKAAGAEPDQMRDEKLHAVVARSTFRSQHVEKHTILGPLLEVEMSKKCMPLWREAHFEVKTYKTHHSRTTFGSWDVEKCMPLWREAHFEVKTYKTHNPRSTFGSWDVEQVHAVVARRYAKHISKSKCTEHHMFAPLLEVQMSFRVAGARDCAPCHKWAKREGFVAFPNTMAGVGHLSRICKNAFSMAGAVQETCSSELLGDPGADFLRGVTFGASDLQVCWDDFAWQLQHFVWPGITFSWQAQ